MSMWKDMLIDEIKELKKEIKDLRELIVMAYNNLKDHSNEKLIKENEVLRDQLMKQELVYQVILHEYEKDLKENQFEAVVLIPYGEKAIVFKHGKPIDTSQAYRVTLDYEANNSSCEINLYSE